MTTQITNKQARTAYLGPEASFSHQAAVEALPQTESVPLPSFSAILKALQDSQPGVNGYDYAVLPVENSTNGSVVQALDLLAKCGLDLETSQYNDVEVVDEHYLEVHHCLFVSRAWAEKRLDTERFKALQRLNGTPALEEADTGTWETDAAKPWSPSLVAILSQLNIKTLYTHPQVWGQCNDLLSTHLPPGRVERVDMSSTSAAAAFVAQSCNPSVANGAVGSHQPVLAPEMSGGIAAISSSLAGAKHSSDLLCIARNIEDEPGANTTRFLLLRNRARQSVLLHDLHHSPSANVQIKSLFAFMISHHVPGSLALALAVFARCGFNLSAIQSRPRPKTSKAITVDGQSNGSSGRRRSQNANWKYVFFVECLHPPDVFEPGLGVEKLRTLQHELNAFTERLVLLGSWRVPLST